MKYRVIIILSLIGFFSNCVKEPYTLLEATLINKSGEDLKVLFYKNGVVQPQDTIFLNNQDSFLFAEPSIQRGDFKGRGFFSDYFGGPNDSIVVIFKNIHKVTHYTNTPDLLSEKYYLFESIRNIGNPESYEFIMIREKGESKRNLHYYTFTESDYEFAKD